jgi:hypothetical protein
LLSPVLAVAVNRAVKWDHQVVVVAVLEVM